MAAPDPVELTRRDAIATVTLRRLDVHNAFDEQVIARVRAGDEGREGVRAFLEKRTPRWAAKADV